MIKRMKTKGGDVSAEEGDKVVMPDDGETEETIPEMAGLKASSHGQVESAPDSPGSSDGGDDDGA